MKGEFFLIGAIFVCVLLFFGTSPNIGITGTATEDINRLADNLAWEMPRALNIGINSSDPIGVLYNFTVFSRGAAEKRRIDLECFWLIFREEGGGVNVTAANFMGSDRTLTINLSGTYMELQVADDSVNSTLFAVPSYMFNVTVTTGSEYMGALMLKNKTSVYSLFSLSREGDLVRKEILA